MPERPPLDELEPEELEPERPLDELEPERPIEPEELEPEELEPERLPPDDDELPERLLPDDDELPAERLLDEPPELLLERPAPMFEPEPDPLGEFFEDVERPFDEVDDALRDVLLDELLEPEPDERPFPELLLLLWFGIVVFSKFV